MMTADRIQTALERLEHLIGERDGGMRYMPLLRRLRAELTALGDDEAEVARLRQRAQGRRLAA